MFVALERFAADVNDLLLRPGVAPSGLSENQCGNCRKDG